MTVESEEQENRPIGRRRVPGEPGLLLIDKGPSVTSHDVVDRVRRGLVRKTRVGHTGTLDPLATGLMVLCVGPATRLQRFFTQMDKTYEGEIRFGFATTTYDSEGEPTDPRGDVESIDPARLEEAVGSLLGEVEQTAPPFSAKKVGGRRFYDMARSGDEVPVVKKTIRISRIKTSPIEGDRMSFTIDCSAGTYIRTVAHDVGVAVGVGAHVSALRRTRIGAFDLENSVTAEEWLDLPPEERFSGDHFVPVDRLELPFPRIMLDARQCGQINRGQQVLVRNPGELVEGGSVALADTDDHLMAIGEVVSGAGWVNVQPRVVLSRG